MVSITGVQSKAMKPVNKVLGIASKAAAPIGAVAGLHALSQAWGPVDPIGFYQYEFFTRPFVEKQLHMPNFGEFVDFTIGSGTGSEIVKANLMTFLTTWFIEEMDVHPKVNQIARIFKNASGSAAMAAAAVQFVRSMTHAITTVPDASLPVAKQVWTMNTSTGVTTNANKARFTTETPIALPAR